MFAIIENCVEKISITDIDKDINIFLKSLYENINTNITIRIAKIFENMVEKSGLTLNPMSVKRYDISGWKVLLSNALCNISFLLYIFKRINLPLYNLLSVPKRRKKRKNKIGTRINTILSFKLLSF